MFVPSFLSEFPDAIVADCVPASGVMLANKMTHNRYPASIAEREALQNAMGTQDVGADAQELSVGMSKRYTLTAPARSGSWATIATALADPLQGVAIFGSYQQLPAYLRNRGRQPSFDGGHCMYGQGEGGGLATIGDPLGTGMLSGIPVADLQRFSAGLQNMAVIGKEQAATLVSYRLNVPAIPGGAILTLFDVMRFTHVLYNAKRVLFAPRGSHATVNHGAPGFWRIVGGYLNGKYAVAGKSGPFTIDAIYSDGSRRSVPIIN